jgi:hypothetical protein
MRSIDNPAELYDGFTDSEKWNFLSGGIQVQNLDDVDVSTMLSEGPFSIPANGSVVVAFAVIGASSIAELQTNADNAQDFWNNPPSGIETPLSSVTEGFELFQNYPNPFNPETNIGFRIPQRGSEGAGGSDFGFTELKIYDLLGREVKTLLNQELLPGRYDVQWDGTNETGAAVSSGVYIYRLQTGNVVLSRKMLLLR